MPKPKSKTVYPMIWFKNKTDEEKEAIRYSLQSNKAFIDSFLSILKSYMTEEELAELSLEDFKSDWTHLHANRLGAKRAYKKIHDLFKETIID